MLDQCPAILFLPQMSTKNKCLLAHKQLSSAANQVDCHWQTPFVYENSMSVISPPSPTHTDDRNTHTHTLALHPHLHYSSTTDQLSCWIPNRTYPINLSQAGIRDWYRGRGTTTSQQACYSRRVTEKLAWKIEGLDQTPQISIGILISDFPLM